MKPDFFFITQKLRDDLLRYLRRAYPRMNISIIEDAVEDAFIEYAYHAPAHVQADGVKAKAYIKKIAWRNLWHENKKGTRSVPLRGMMTVESEEEYIAIRLTYEAYRDSLHGKDRICFEMRDEDYAYEEIAKALHSSKNAAEVRMNRIIKKLRGGVILH
jgi:DNA-directed RNA polymerase specialized sigma24 family protein